MRKFLDDETNIFAPEVILILVAALEEAWAAFQASDIQFDGLAEDAQEILATRIIATAKGGERDQSRLAGDAVGHLAKQIGTKSAH